MGASVASYQKRALALSQQNLLQGQENTAAQLRSTVYLYSPLLITHTDVEKNDNQNEPRLLCSNQAVGFQGFHPHPAPRQRGTGQAPPPLPPLLLVGRFKAPTSPKRYDDIAASCHIQGSKTIFQSPSGARQHRALTTTALKQERPATVHAHTKRIRSSVVTEAAHQLVDDDAGYSVVPRLLSKNVIKCLHRFSLFLLLYGIVSFRPDETKGVVRGGMRRRRRWEAVGWISGGTGGQSLDGLLLCVCVFLYFFATRYVLLQPFEMGIGPTAPPSLPGPKNRASPLPRPRTQPHTPTPKRPHPHLHLQQLRRFYRAQHGHHGRPHLLGREGERQRRPVHPLREGPHHVPRHEHGDGAGAHHLSEAVRRGLSPRRYQAERRVPFLSKKMKDGWKKGGGLGGGR